MGLNLNDFSKQFMNDNDLSISKIPISSPFVRVILPNKTSIVIKTSSLCWLLEQLRDRVSSDMFRRFINTSNCRLNYSSENSHQTISLRKGKSKKKIKTQVNPVWKSLLRTVPHNQVAINYFN